jgi:predicted transposase YdaD
MLYEARLKAQRDEYSRIRGAREEGLEEGLDKGRKEGLEEGREEGLDKGRKEGLEEGEVNATRRIVLEMGNKGLDIGMIAAVTRLREGEVKGILKEGKEGAGNK